MRAVRQLAVDPSSPPPPPLPRPGDPLYAVYSASKAYMDFFSRSLNLELRNEGIFVQCQVPYFVTTKLSKLRRASLLIPTPGAYARAAVAWIGAKRRPRTDRGERACP